MVEQLPDNADGRWTNLLSNAAQQFAAKQPEDVLGLAWQAVQFGEQPLAHEILSKSLAPERERVHPSLIFSAVQLLYWTGKPRLAQEWLDPLLEDYELAKQPALWRLAAAVAQQCGDPRRQWQCVEKALDLEFALLPEMVDVEQIRSEYGALLKGFEQWISDYYQKGEPLPRDFAAKIVKVADRWRSLDPDGAEACFQAANLLGQLHEPTLAWQYLTTPIAQKPHEAGPFRQLAQELAEKKDWTLAEKAYGAAFAAEPTDPQLLWERAMALDKQGRTAEMSKLMQQIADSDWQPRFDATKASARRWLGR
jgi:hypothetical protein